MPDLCLNESEQAGLRALLAAEPVPGRPLPGPEILERLNALVPCDVLLTAYVDMTGLVTAQVSVVPEGGGRSTVVSEMELHEQHGGPFYLGVMHWRLHPALAEGCGNLLGPREDALAIGFRNGTDHVVQYAFGRTSRHFSARDLAMLDMLGPVLQRLARERPTPALPSALTITERRVLCEVAAGLSNAEIAEGQCVSIGTVRKHLENTYRKLGVTNRVAAIARLRGSDQPNIDLFERIDRYA